MVDFLCDVDVTSLRSFVWMTFDFGDAELLTGFFLLCESAGESVVFCTTPPSGVLPFVRI